MRLPLAPAGGGCTTRQLAVPQRGTRPTARHAAPAARTSVQPALPAAREVRAGAPAAPPLRRQLDASSPASCATEGARAAASGSGRGAALSAGVAVLAGAVQHALPPGAAAAAAPGTDLLFEAGQAANDLVLCSLSSVTPVTYLIVLAAGLATSLSPCTLSVLPLTIGYIGGYAEVQGPSSAGGGSAKPNLPLQAACFSLGLATTLALLGVASSLLGQAYGTVGEGLPLAAAALAIAMGLNLLQVLPLQLPSLDVDVRALAAPRALQAYAAGLAFALAASPCSTPVLATLLTWVSSNRDPLQGGGLLLAYTCGYVAPLLVAATVAGSMKQLMDMRKYSAWVTPASGALLVAGGTYSLLSRLVPA